MSLQKIKIKSKKNIGIKQVYDISVPSAHHYLLDSGVVSHNSGFIYASSIVVAMQKRKLKEDEDGKKVTDVRGIRAACKVMKTRYNKPFENVEIKIPWETGMDPYSGLIEVFEKKNVLVKDGNKLKYIDKSGKEHKYFRSTIPESLLNQIMDEWDETRVTTTYVDIETTDELSGETDGN
jgi:hypothetical protein